MTRPFTPEALAERWHCSAETIRQMCARGDLPHFRVGRMIRIPAQAVEERECQNIASVGSMAGSSSHGPARTGAAAATALQPRQLGQLTRKRAI
jgi:excisionase family DNA binding protein